MKKLFEVTLTVYGDEDNNRTTSCKITGMKPGFEGEASTYIDCLRENLENMSGEPIVKQ